MTKPMIPVLSLPMPTRLSEADNGAQHGASEIVSLHEDYTHFSVSLTVLKSMEILVMAEDDVKVVLISKIETNCFSIFLGNNWLQEYSSHGTWL